MKSETFLTAGDRKVTFGHYHFMIRLMSCHCWLTRLEHFINDIKARLIMCLNNKTAAW